MEKNPCSCPVNSFVSVGVPASTSRAANRSPSSRSGSCSAISTVAGGSPPRSSTRSGLISGWVGSVGPA
ncbi:hypothetical protein BJF90_36205 [Pseudonocardia sp. CNS-004]|nr:hypothetical protein BJF90_36205 [Pseudonocardia sp. CNS-004]